MLWPIRTRILVQRDFPVLLIFLPLLSSSSDWFITLVAAVEISSENPDHESDDLLDLEESSEKRETRVEKLPREFSRTFLQSARQTAKGKIRTGHFTRTNCCLFFIFSAAIPEHESSLTLFLRLVSVHLTKLLHSGSLQAWKQIKGR